VRVSSFVLVTGTASGMQFPTGIGRRFTPRFPAFFRRLGHLRAAAQGPAMAVCAWRVRWRPAFSACLRCWRHRRAGPQEHRRNRWNVAGIAVTPKLFAIAPLNEPSRYCSQVIWFLATNSFHLSSSLSRLLKGDGDAVMSGSSLHIRGGDEQPFARISSASLYCPVLVAREYACRGHCC
jgi:hypothetical protein